MEDRDLKENRDRDEERREAYAPPEATVVPVALQPRLGGCNFSTIQVCGLTEV